MCRRITCNKCGKPSFAGCGMHVEQVLGDVPRDQRCRCAEKRDAKGSNGERSFLDRLLGR
jgi:hypothetical protein